MFHCFTYEHLKCLFLLFTSLKSSLSLGRLERLQRVVGKVQMESGVCEEQLNQVETLLQAVRVLNVFTLKRKKRVKLSSRGLKCRL